MAKHFNIQVMGKVQGIFFRTTTQQKAQELGIGGFVRNKSDDSVYIEAEASEDVLNEFIKWLKNGVRNAEVKKIEKSNGTIKNFNNFDIRYD